MLAEEFHEEAARRRRRMWLVVGVVLAALFMVFVGCVGVMLTVAILANS